jgi:hypothetical protein
MSNLEPWKIDIANLYSHPKLKPVNEEIVSDYMLNAQKWCFNQQTNQIDNVKV